MHAVFGPGQKLRVGFVEFQVRGPHHQIGDLHFGEFPNLRVGERGLGRAAAPQQIDFLDRAFLERLQRVVGDVGRGQFFDRARQDAGDVHRHVAVADDGHALHPAQVVLQVAVVGMPVVPADENGRRVAAGQVFARNAQPAVRFGPGRKQDLVIVAEHLVEEHVLTERDVAEEAEARPAGDLLVLADDGLDLLMVGGHAATHQPIRGRQAVEHIDADGHVFLPEQFAGGIEAGRSGAEDSHAEREGIGADLGRHTILFLGGIRLASVAFSTRSGKACSLYRQG